MKAIHYVAAFSPLSQTFVYDLISGLEKRGLTENTVLTRRRELEKERPFPKTFICKDRNPFRKLVSKLTDPSHLKIHNQKIVLEHFQRVKPNLIHSHFGISAIRMHDLLVRNNLSIPHICSFHGSDVQSNPHKIEGYKDALLRLNSYPNVLMTVPGQFLKEVCLDLGLKEEKLVIVPNTIHPRFLDHNPAHPWDGVEKLIIVTVGRLVEMKGHEYAIRAMAKLKEVFPNFEYWIAGSGVLEEKLKLLTSELNLDGEVKFLGSRSHEDIPELLGSAHICLIPSVRAHDGEEDTFCLSLVEGAAMGLYCLSSDTRGPLEVLGEHKEFVFQQKSPNAIFEALVRAIKDKTKMAEKAQILRSELVNRFHPEKYFQNYSKLYKGITGNRHED